ncbi:MAG TPA: hypothetical protein VEW69_10845, partial [Alphaproteobacteria bacterium]|nr:hypothetical protein [Alphaproteobacteria bacterium]
MAFPFLQRVNLAESARQLSLTSYVPSLVLEGMVTGIDNLRHDVFLSAKFTDAARLYIARLVARYGNVEDLISDNPYSSRSGLSSRQIGNTHAPKPMEPAEFKRMLADLHVAALNRAKAENNVSYDLLFRLAMLKFQRTELLNQYNLVLERCRAKAKFYEGTPSTNRTVEIRGRFVGFQINKKAILRRAGQDLFVIIRETEKETLGKTRRSLFGETAAAAYDLFLNRLVFTEDGRDDYLNAEHYVMLGNYERDTDRMQTVAETARQFLRSLELVAEADGAAIEALLA